MRKWVPRTLWSFVACLALWIGTVAGFDLLGAYWTVDDPPVSSDVIVVLGGNRGRAERAAELWREGWAGRLLVMPHDYGDSHRVLVSRQVPPEVITTLGEVRTTLDEARATYTWAEKTGARRILIVTDCYHTRRARLLFQDALSRLSPDVVVNCAAVYPPGLSRNNWWRTDEGRSLMKRELFKCMGLRLGFAARIN